MRTIFIYGTDIHGPEDWWAKYDWVEKPWTDNGRLKWTMSDRATMDHLMYQAAGIAGIDSLAILLRGARGSGFATPELKASIEDYAGPFVDKPPTICPFIDTGALSAITAYEGGTETAFDFGNQQHLDWFWTYFLKPYFDQFPEGAKAKNPIKYERSKNGRIVVVFWSINPQGREPAAGVVNQQLAGRLLDKITVRMIDAGLSTPDCIVDRSWVERAPVRPFAVHNWFNAAEHTAYSVRRYNGITTGVAVPGFHVPTQPGWVIPRNGGQTLRDALAAMREAKADYVLLESLTNVSESAMFGMSEATDPPTLCLDIVREHIHPGVPAPAPVPVPPPPAPPVAPLAPDTVPVVPIVGTLTGLRLNGGAIGVDPKDGPGLSDDQYPVYADRQRIREWEEAVVMRLPNGFYSVQFRASHRQLSINDRGALESRPEGWVGSWELFTLSQAAGRVTLERPGVDTVLTIENYRETKLLTKLRIVGRDFFDDYDERHTIIGSTELLLAWRYDQEGAEAIRPTLQERQALGFNNLRVLWQKDINNSNRPWLMPLAKLRPFLELAASYGFYVQGTILADCHVVNPSVADQQQRVSMVRTATAGMPNLLEQLGNEADKNGHDPRNFTRPADRLAANSSSTSSGPGKDYPYWDFFCFSGARSPANSWIRENGPVEFMYGRVQTWGGVPAICDEGAKPGTNDYRPRDWERAGAQARSGCGGRFHSVTGTGDKNQPQIVPSGLFTPFERECAAAFVKGLKG